LTPRSYATPGAFKQAVETRLKTLSSTGLDFGRRRQLLVFDRFLARIVPVLGEAATLKGGLALELRIERARTTKDIDLRMIGSPDRILEQLQEGGRLDAGDFMTFEVRPDAEHPDIQNEGMRYEGMRFRAECRLAGKIYGQSFGVDVCARPSTRPSRSERRTRRRLPYRTLRPRGRRPTRGWPRKMTCRGPPSWR
jgi:hypothetical protein